MCTIFVQRATSCMQVGCGHGAENEKDPEKQLENLRNARESTAMQLGMVNTFISTTCKRYNLNFKRSRNENYTDGARSTYATEAQKQRRFLVHYLARKRTLESVVERMDDIIARCEVSSMSFDVFQSMEIALEALQTQNASTSCEYIDKITDDLREAIHDANATNNAVSSATTLLASMSGGDEVADSEIEEILRHAQAREQEELSEMPMLTTGEIDLIHEEVSRTVRETETGLRTVMMSVE